MWGDGEKPVDQIKKIDHYHWQVCTVSIMNITVIEQETKKKKTNYNNKITAVLFVDYER